MLVVPRKERYRRVSLFLLLVVVWWLDGDGGGGPVDGVVADDRRNRSIVVVVVDAAAAGTVLRLLLCTAMVVVSRRLRYVKHKSKMPYPVNRRKDLARVNECRRGDDDRLLNIGLCMEEDAGDAIIEHSTGLRCREEPRCILLVC